MLLSEQIEKAFANIQYPGDDRLVVPEHDWESREVAALFKGRHWRDVSLELLLSHRFAIWFLSPEAYRFYLPAFLFASMEDDADSVYESLLNSLAPPPDGIGTLHDFLERVEGLDAAQKEAVRSFLQSIVDEGYSSTDNLVQRALECYWNDPASFDR